MTFLRMAGAMALALLCAQGGAMAQTTAASVQAPAGYAPMQATCVKQLDGTCSPVSATAPLPTTGFADSFGLAAANVPASAVTVAGGRYVVSQVCSAYGTLTVRYRGPDGATMLTLLSKTAADSGGGTLITLAAGAVIDATVSGTTGCNATLVRVP